MPSPTIEDDKVMARTQVMVVEDEGVVALSLQQKLRGLGYEVPAIVATGEQALQRAAELRPDLILMDIMLAGALDGIEAAHQIRARLDDLVRLLQAAQDRAEGRRHLLHRDRHRAGSGRRRVRRFGQQRQPRGSDGEVPRRLHADQPQHKGRQGQAGLAICARFSALSADFRAQITGPPRIR